MGQGRHGHPQHLPRHRGDDQEPVSRADSLSRPGRHADRGGGPLSQGAVRRRHADRVHGCLSDRRRCRRGCGDHPGGARGDLPEARDPGAGPSALLQPDPGGAAPVLEHRRRHAARVIKGRAPIEPPLPQSSGAFGPGRDRPGGRGGPHRPGVRRHPALRGLSRPSAARPQRGAVPAPGDRGGDGAAARAGAGAGRRDRDRGRLIVQDRGERQAAGAGAGGRNHRADRPRPQRSDLGFGGVRLQDVPGIRGGGGAGADDAQVVSPLSRAAGGGGAAAGGGGRAHGVGVVPRAARQAGQRGRALPPQRGPLCRAVSGPRQFQAGERSVWARGGERGAPGDGATLQRPHPLDRRGGPLWRRRVRCCIGRDGGRGGARRGAASIGVAEYRQEKKDEDVLVAADRALYRAKAAGRNRVATGGDGEEHEKAP